MTAADLTGRAVAAAILALFLFASEGRSAHAQQNEGAPLPPGLPSYVPQSVTFPDRPSYLTTDGNICIVGYNDMSALLQALNELFAAAHPGFRFRLHLPSTRAAPAALALGLSAFAPMGAEFSHQQLEAYTDAVGTLPQPIAVAHASLNPRALSAPLGIYVHRSNPLNSLTLDQAARIFTEHAGADAINTWDDLGLRGEWAGQPIHALGLGPQTALGTFMQSHKFAAQPYRKDFTAFTNSADVIKRVSSDVHSIGFADLNGATPGVKALAIASSARSIASTGTAEDIVSGRYPLDRYLYIYLRRRAGTSIEPWIREYLRLALSQQGQRAIRDAEPGYLPLNSKEARSSLAQLDEPTPDARPATIGANLITCAGGETMQPLALHWGNAFRAQHPTVEIKVDTSAKLSADGFGALLDGRVSCVLMVREPFAAEAQAFEHRFGHAPGLLRVATGSFDTRGGTNAIAIYTNRVNPLRRISLEQLDAVFAATPQSGRVPIVKWGQLGLKGAWTDKPVHVYGMLPRRETGNPPGIVNFLQQRVLSGGTWRSDLRVQTDAPGRSALQAIVQQVAEDPLGIGYSGFGFRQAGVRALAIGATEDGPFIAGARASVSDRTYPLTRSVYIAFDPNVMASPDSPLPDFLRYILSPEAQRAIADDSEGFIPLPLNELEASRQSLTSLTRWRCE